MVFRRNCSLSVLSSSPLFSLNSFSLPSLLVFLFFLSFTYHLSFLLSLFLSSSASLSPFCSVSLPPSDSLSFLILFSFISFLFLYIQNVSSFSFYMCKTCGPSFIMNLSSRTFVIILPFFLFIILYLFFSIMFVHFSIMFLYIRKFLFCSCTLFFFIIITKFILSYIIMFPISPLSVKYAM